MNFKKIKSRIRRMGSALVITLVMVVLVTIIAVAYLASVAIEGRSAKAFLDEQRAGEMANIGLHSAIARLRDGLGPWDNPLQNFTNTAPPFFWSISPGRLTRWDYTNVTPQSNIALFSDPSLVPNTANTTNLVNLNRRRADGSFPIIGGTNAPELSVKWVNVLADPLQPASKSNQVVGRFAFWIDDENAKINLNTADGTKKGNRLFSPGAGTPGEVSLESFASGAVATNIVQMARRAELITPRDLLQVSGVSSNVFSENAFAFTTYNRSPEFNIFGESKIYLIPGYIGSSISYIALNGITEQPLTEIYPTPSQLPGFTARFKTMDANGASRLSTLTTTAPWNGTSGGRAWPLVFQQNSPKLEYSNSSNFYLANCGGWNFALIAKYLGGVNGMDKSIQWPVFAGTELPAQGFKGKYSLRQLDSIAMQVTDLGFKATTPDGGTTQDSPYSLPTATWGYLSGELVNGTGRFARVNEVLVNMTAYAETGTYNTEDYEAPYMRMDIYIEWFLPGGFAGVDLLNWNPATSGISQNGDSATCGRAGRAYLNIGDVPPPNNSTLITVNPNAVVEPGPFPPKSFWQDGLLRSDGGIDFLGNPEMISIKATGTNATYPAAGDYAVADPDQTKGVLYHAYNEILSGTTPPRMGVITTANKDAGKIAGTGLGSTIGRMAPITDMAMLGWGNTKLTSECAWYPGQYWCIKNKYGSTNYRMRAGATAVKINGGLAIQSVITGNRGDFDPVPLEAKRGLGSSVEAKGEVTNGSGESLTDPAVVDRAKEAVLPLDATLMLPGAAAGVWRHFQVEDPLVNKFPGDWQMSANSVSSIETLPSMSTPAPRNGISRYFKGLNKAAKDHPNFDPDSYWLPTIDRTIPRSARFPSIGYLQYLRTGIIPDDETGPFSGQKGTPYRLISFAPSTETSSQKTSKADSKAYPDWAMLDLFTIPSTIKPQGTFGGATSGRINPNGAVVYTTNTETPTPGISRTLPLKALFRGLKVNETLETDSNGTSMLTGGETIDEVAIATAIEEYIRTNGPLRLPGEICNIPAIAAKRPAQNPTRNDLVRQTIGELTTQSNAFTVWVAGQAIRKIPTNTGYDQFEVKDNVLAEVRYLFVVERYLDPGKDGVYGSTSSPGDDKIRGTWDDLMNVNDHPLAPRYLYRVISAEEIR